MTPHNHAKPGDYAEAGTRYDAALAALQPLTTRVDSVFNATLALITALWSGPARTRSIALWSAIGGAISALGPLFVNSPASLKPTFEIMKKPPLLRWRAL